MSILPVLIFTPISTSTPAPSGTVTVTVIKLGYNDRSSYRGSH